MDRDRFESALDRVIAAHGRKVCAEIDAGACRTPRDFQKMHRPAMPSSRRVTPSWRRSSRRLQLHLRRLRPPR